MSPYNQKLENGVAQHTSVDCIKKEIVFSCMSSKKRLQVEEGMCAACFGGESTQHQTLEFSGRWNIKYVGKEGV